VSRGLSLTFGNNGVTCTTENGRRVHKESLIGETWRSGKHYCIQQLVPTGRSARASCTITRQYETAIDGNICVSGVVAVNLGRAVRVTEGGGVDIRDVWYGGKEKIKNSHNWFDQLHDAGQGGYTGFWIGPAQSNAIVSPLRGSI